MLIRKRKTLELEQDYISEEKLCKPTSKGGGGKALQKNLYMLIHDQLFLNSGFDGTLLSEAVNYRRLNVNLFRIKKQTNF